jgi:nicotinate-nucleotide adenylyltransferase
MVDTLKSFREVYGPEQPLALLVGADSINQLTTWYHWPDLFKLAHIIAFSRPTYSFKLSEALTPYLTPNITPCFTTPSGLLCCYFCKTVAISSTKIREALRHAQNTEHFLHSSTYTYILNNKVCLLTNG